MIKVENSNVSFSGSNVALQAELTTVMKNFVKNGIADEEILLLAVRMALADDEEVDKIMSEMKQELKQQIAYNEWLKELLWSL